MSKPLFTIVTITLNCADDAVRTAATVLEQSFPDYEYIVKDGGSTDGTAERLRAMGVGRVVVAQDDGIYAAMNQALALCSGEYVCFLNAGDRFAGPQVLATVAASIRQQRCPDLLYGDIRSLVRHPFLTTEQPDAHGRLICYPPRIGRFYLYRKMICHQAWFVRRAIYQAAPFDTSYQILADYHYLLTLILQRRVRYLHVPTVVAIFGGDGTSTQASARRTEERERALRAAYSRPELMLYRTLFEGIKWINRTIVYPWIYPRLPERLRGRASGL